MYIYSAVGYMNTVVLRIIKLKNIDFLYIQAGIIALYLFVYTNNLCLVFVERFSAHYHRVHPLPAHQATENRCGPSGALPLNPNFRFYARQKTINAPCFMGDEPQSV